MISRILIGACAAIILYLGSVHLAYTFFTQNFHPTDAQLETVMKPVAPRISHDMTMWKAWIGFHISHSLGLMLFGLMFEHGRAKEPPVIPSTGSCWSADMAASTAGSLA